MPKLPIDYSKTIIYKICCNDVNITDIYVGHTTDLTRRRQRHKSKCNNENGNEYNQYKYQFIRENGGWENWSLIPIEEYPCENVNQARIKERYYIEELKANLNSYIPSRTSKEYHQDYKEHLKEIKKEYYDNNREIFKEKGKEFYHNNKDRINEKRKETFTCECGSICRISDKTRHLKTQKHQDYLTQTIPANNLT